MSATYYNRKAEGLCTSCGDALPDGWTKTMCVGCGEAHSILTQQWQRANPEKFKAHYTRAGRKRLQRARDAGLCVRCRAPAKIGKDGKPRARCEACTEAAAERYRESRRVRNVLTACPERDTTHGKETDMRITSTALILAALSTAACVADDVDTDQPDAGDAEPDADVPTPAQLDATLGRWVIVADIGFCAAGETRQLDLTLARHGSDVVEVNVATPMLDAGVELYPFKARVRVAQVDQQWDVELTDGDGVTAAKVAWSAPDGNCSTVVDAVIAHRVR